jgi:hypothetical protein
VLVTVDPRCDVVEALRPDRHGAHPALLAGGHQAGVLEDAHVLLGGPVQRHREALGEVADRVASPARALEDPAARGVRERHERAVELRGCVSARRHGSQRGEEPIECVEALVHAALHAARDHAVALGLVGEERGEEEAGAAVAEVSNSWVSMTGYPGMPSHSKVITRRSEG